MHIAIMTQIHYKCSNTHLSLALEETGWMATEKMCLFMLSPINAIQKLHTCGMALCKENIWHMHGDFRVKHAI